MLTWGAGQIALLCSDQYGAVCGQLKSTPVLRNQDEPIVFDEEAVAEAEAMLLVQQAEWEKSKAKVLAAATITLENA